MGSVQPVLEVPDNPVAQTQSQFLEYRVEIDVEREDFTVVHVVTNLPADAAVGPQQPHKLRDDGLLPLQVLRQSGLPLIALTQIVGRRCDDE